jgi:hypothetical protein
VKNISKNLENIQSVVGLMAEVVFLGIAVLMFKFVMEFTGGFSLLMQLAGEVGK